MSIRTPFALALIVSLSACSATREFTPINETPSEDIVQLRYAPLPEVILSTLSIHYWFVVYNAEEKRWTRWEFWRRCSFWESLTPLGNGVRDTGHIRRDLFHPDSEIGGGATVVAEEWIGADARRLRAVIEDPERFPKRRRYWGWPGPNSNTYVANALRLAKVGADLDPRAIGKDELGFIGAAVTTTGTGLQFETPLFGFKIGLLDGVELHFLTMTFGLDWLCPALKTPAGRLGFPRDLGQIDSDIKLGKNARREIAEDRERCPNTSAF